MVVSGFWPYFKSKGVKCQLNPQKRWPKWNVCFSCAISSFCLQCLDNLEEYIGEYGINKIRLYLSYNLKDL